MMLRAAILLFALAAAAAGQAGRSARPPAQPESGPGGRENTSRSVTMASFGEGATQYWLFEPADPAPEAAPVIVFLHGWNGVNPGVYLGWIEHLVRRGNVVVYPRYQENAKTPPREFLPNAVASVRDALSRLETGGHVHPQPGLFAVVGHSAGGNVAASLAAMAVSAGLPPARALMSVDPGNSWLRAKRAAIPLEHLEQIPAATLVLAVTGDADRLVRDVDAKRIFTETTAVPASNKDFVLVVSDDHGSPALVANHLAPCARADALDFYAFWKLFDALCDAAFYNRNREYALGNTPEQRYMGAWSDGTPVRELVLTHATEARP
jgi:poly(3-hydroxybutyrate) depolymerase